MTHTKCKIVGLTGGIATGKSTVSKILRDNGYIVIDADVLSRKVVEIGKPAYNKIIDCFGSHILSDDNTIDRKALGKLIFSNDRLRLKLNAITHPDIFEELKKEADKNCRDNKLIFLDIPLLFEEYDSLIEVGIDFEEIWLIHAKETTQINRLMKRDNLDRHESLSRIKNQMPMVDKLRMANVIIYNDEDKLILKSNVLSALLDLE